MRLPRRWVLGLDGCRGGWVGVGLAVADGRLLFSERFARFADALARGETAATIAVDMPIGLPDLAERGGRACERLARARLGPRRSSVFATPSRPALAKRDYPRALGANRRGGGPGLSKQCFHLFPKMREIDALMTPALQARVRECHPELAFAVLVGAPMAHPKRTREGRVERLAALATAGFSRDAFEPHPFARKEVAPDDLLDAAVVAWSARRIARGEALVLPEAPPRDPRGLRMEIVA
jgi:predicted RNase H-like nuclease